MSRTLFGGTKLLIQQRILRPVKNVGISFHAKMHGPQIFSYQIKLLAIASDTTVIFEN